MPGRDSQYCVVTEPGEYRVRTRSSAFHDCPALSGSFTVTSIVDVATEDDDEPRVVHHRTSSVLLFTNGTAGEIVRILTILGETVRSVAIDGSTARISTMDLPCGAYIVMGSSFRPRTLIICK